MQDIEITHVDLSNAIDGRGKVWIEITRVDLSNAIDGRDKVWIEITP